MKLYIRSEEDVDAQEEPVYRITITKRSSDRLGQRRTRTSNIDGTLPDQIEALQRYYDSWKDYYMKVYGKEMRFDNIKSIDNVLTRYRQISKACKQMDESFFSTRSYKAVEL